jgi:glutamate dehydrogenase
MAKTDPLGTLQKQAAAEARKLGPPSLSAFAAILLSGATFEDIVEYSPSDLAAMAADSHAHFAIRKPGRPKIRISNPPAPFDSVTAIDVINDDMPFLVDSTLALLNELGAEIRLLLHPIVLVSRGAGGELIEFGDRHAGLPNASRESVMRIHLSRIVDEESLLHIREELESALTDVRLAVLDWSVMQARLRQAIETYRTSPPPVPLAELSESIAFLQWLLDNHFTFLGMRDYAFNDAAKKDDLKPVDGTGLGMLRRPEIEVLMLGGRLVTMTPEIRKYLMLPVTLVITKADVRARVHRRVTMDYIGVKLFSPDGDLTGELRVVGLLTSSAYTQNPHEIPVIRKKLQWVFAASGHSPDSHSGKALNNILEHYPRDELFQIEAETLAEFSRGILQLEERPRTRLFARHDRFGRFVSALVFIPRDRFNTEARIKVGDLLAEAYGGSIAGFSPAFSETPLVRVHYMVALDPERRARPDPAELEKAVAEAVRNWDDRLAVALAAAGMADRQRRWLGAFPAGYTSRIAATEAIKDIAEIDRLADSDMVAVEFIADAAAPASRCRLKLYRDGAAVPLSARLPILGNMGFRSISETTYELQPTGLDGSAVAVIHDVLIESDSGAAVDVAGLREILEDCFMAVWTGRAENDIFNALTLIAGLPWKEVAILRALARYLRQAGGTYSGDYMGQTLVKHAGIARQLVALFKAMFDPAAGGAADPRSLRAAIAAALEQIPSLDEDTIIRRYLNLIDAILRTNCFQPDPVPTLAFKIASRAVEGLPDPKPFAEIFVYSPDVEGIHLRAGPIARGGLRWSDRPEDFRTEVLGLAKAQNVKNAVIVPVGAKGGFVPKKLPAGGSREQVQAEGIRAYKLFVSSLLSLTDNITAQGLVPPPGTVRRDDDDPYLVVAADKGTATFSDIANGLSDSRGFWLGDAFASGGSAGYDHKGMGITARGAWEAVRRHFRERGIDTQSQAFTVIGVGDMSGDVFGNGMLLSPLIRLLAAFDHRDIFIDPDPDPASGFAERQRLFALPRSSWQDYDRALISRGGGVFSRQAKAIPLSPELRALTGLTGDTATPQALMRALLTAEADLLWFGGIGTYIKAASETHADARDRANDAIRVDAADIRASVIGEGANLGVTQRGRIEFAMKGGSINTDAVDNSAGVNTSDVEVNIKIALGAAEQAGRLDRATRNEFLAAMTGAVAALVLRNNYLQTLCLSLAVAQGSEGNGYAIQLMNMLEQRGLLDRRLEALPSDQAVAERDARGQCLTRPEFAVLMAYAKLALNSDLLASRVPDDPYLARELLRYFPEAMHERFRPEIEAHRLRREIIATMLANSMINRGGPAFVSRLMEETGAAPGTIAAAFAVARDSFGFIALNGLLDELDNRIAGPLQLNLYLELQRRLTWATIWFIRHEKLDGGLAELVASYQAGIAAVSDLLAETVGDEARASLEAETRSLMAEGVPEATARRLSAGPYLQRAPDIVLIARETGVGMPAIARALFAAARELRIDRLVAEVARLTAHDFVERRAINRLVGQLFQTHRAIVARVVGTREQTLEAWMAGLDAGQPLATKAVAAIDQLLAERKFDLARLAVAQGILADLALR